MGFETKEDKIGRKEFVDKIAYCVDNLQEDQNMCIAIDGEWGSGKSFVMRKLYDRLNMNDNYLVVKYDAWECSYYDEPLIAVFSSILDSVNEKLLFLHNRQEGVKAVAKEIGKDLLDTFSKQKNIFGALATILKKVKHYAMVYKKGIIIDTKNEDVANFHSYQTYLREVKLCMNDFTTFVDEAGNKNKLIILVDELDRCLPDMQLKILERLHHLFDVKNCAVVCAINEASVAKNVETTYGVDGYEYLRKFFDLNYKLEMSTAVYLKNLLNDFKQVLLKINEGFSKCFDAIDVAYICLLNGHKNVLDRVDNRELSRYYSALLNICDNFGWKKFDSRNIFYVIVGLYVRKCVAQQFLSDHDILIRQNIEKIKYYSPDFDYEDMPYYDFLDEYVGIDRQNLDADILRLPQGNMISELSWDFNEMIFYSMTSFFDYNEFQAFIHKTTLDTEVCRELCRLIILYGGEQKNA